MQPAFGCIYDHFFSSTTKLTSGQKCSTVFSGLQVAPEYKPHPLFLPKIWEKFIDKSHLSISRTLFCYFLARRNVFGCIHVMRRSAKERQDAIDVVQKTLHAGLIAWAKVCGDAVI